jgi:hypothetical protein
MFDLNKALVGVQIQSQLPGTVVAQYLSSDFAEERERFFVGSFARGGSSS